LKIPTNPRNPTKPLVVLRKQYRFLEITNPLLGLLGVGGETAAHFMRIDIKKLKNVTRKFRNNELVTIAQCPACAADGHDRNGRNHLIIRQDGRFGCVINQGDTEHNKEILDLVGIEDTSEASPPVGRPPRQKRPRPRPINPIPTKITYIKLKIRPQPEAEEQTEVV
jgi:hypothetical protein